jgi:hypothetical protein
LVLAALGLCAWAVWVYKNYSDDFGLSTSRKALVLTAEDLDPESTALVLKLLQDNQADNRIALALLREEKPSQTALAELAPALAQGEVPPAFLPAAERLRNALGNNEAGVYTIWVEPGETDVRGSVTLTLDGYPWGRFPVDSARYALSLLLRRNSSARLRIQAEGGDQPSFTFRAETAGSEGCTRRLRPGRADEWILWATAK